MNIQSVLATKGTRVVTVRADAVIAEAASLLTANDIGALVVVDAEGKLGGIISERDIARSIATFQADRDLRVRELMTSDVTCALLADEVVTVLRRMTLGRFRHLPVVEGGEVVGVVSIGDLVKAQLSEDEGVILTLETMLMGVPA
jgi:CBS domain-containing protein